VGDDFEMADGSRPQAAALSAEAGKRFPLSAFTILKGGDVFESVSGRAPPEGKARALEYVQSQVSIEPHGAGAEHLERIRSEMVRQLSGNPQLAQRLGQARPIAVDVIPPGGSMAKYGYPKGVPANVSGLFWDHPSWPRARIAFRQERLLTENHLVIHEMAHAICFLAFTDEERKAVYRTMLRTYVRESRVDEVFAIYSEREFQNAFRDVDKNAPGVYGEARKRWDENHVFTRFVRNLYFPYKPLAGPRISGGGPNLLG
jgi:pentatricopeptide repeat protein